MNAHRSDSELDRALDGLLARTLLPPQLPPRFRADVEAARARLKHTDLAQLRMRFEGEHLEQLARVEADFVRVRRSPLGLLIGAAVAVGVGAAYGLPWLSAHVGLAAPAVIAWGSAALALGIGVAALRGWIA